MTQEPRRVCAGMQGGSRTSSRRGRSTCDSKAVRDCSHTASSSVMRVWDCSQAASRSAMRMWDCSRAASNSVMRKLDCACCTSSVRSKSDTRDWDCACCCSSVAWYCCRARTRYHLTVRCYCGLCYFLANGGECAYHGFPMRYGTFSMCRVPASLALQPDQAVLGRALRLGSQTFFARAKHRAILTAARRVRHSMLWIWIKTWWRVTRVAFASMQT